MIRDDKQRVIGKLVNINSEKFTVELLNQSINFTVNGFDDIYQYAQINSYVILPYQDFYIVAEIFGVRERDADIKWHGEKEQVLSKSNSVKYLDITPIGTVQSGKFKYGVSVFPTLYSDVLYVKKEELDIVFEVKNESEVIDIEGIEGTKLNMLDIGTSTIFPDYKVKIDINSFFGAHSAILGNTGSGKSCTISSMMQALLEKNGFSAVGATFIFFDVNGEYHKAFSQITNPDIEIKYFSLEKIKDNAYFKYPENFKIGDNIHYKKFKLPHWFLNIEEWALLLQASDKTQLPILRNAINLLKLFAGNAYALNKVKNHILYLCLLHILRDESSPPSKKDRIIAILSKFHTNEIGLHVKLSQGQTLRSSLHINYGEMPQMENLIQYLEREGADGAKEFYMESFNIPTGNEVVIRTEFDEIENALDLSILFEEAHGNSQIRDYCSSLLTRYKSLKERSEFTFMTGVKDDIDKPKYINKILGISENETKRTQISIIDLNSVEDEIVEVVSCVLSRIVFEKLKHAEHRNTFPVNVILEEAHRYISNDPGSFFGSANKIFERIAKEGRKYGMFLLVSSQRPSELSRTVLSQCSNFIVHRIQNPEDLTQIRQMTPHISASILSRLPSIPRQHALVFGHAVQIPTLFKVNNANPTPHSSDNNVTKNWFRPKIVDEFNEEFVELLSEHALFGIADVKRQNESNNEEVVSPKSNPSIIDGKRDGHIESEWDKDFPF
jgi:DNA helicase HerA-like ATPase